jgi:hypothetical protein
MWVRRALQRAEPGAQTGFQGRTAGRLLGALQIVLNNHLHAERPEGEAWAFNLYFIIFLYYCY